MKSKKRAFTAPYHFPIIFLSILPYTIWQNLYNLAKLQLLPDYMEVLPNCFTFAKSYEVLPKGFTFAKLYPTFAKRFILFSKNPRTQVHPLPNVKLPLKTQENNVTFRPMYCQECRIYGLCEVSATLSTEN
jgi:hypothetical protein